MSAGAPSGDNSQDLKGTWRLPRQVHKTPKDVVAYNQRLRLLAGVARALSRNGYASLSVEQVVEEAGVSRSTFYENFENKHDCVLAGHEFVFDCLERELIDACEAAQDWPKKVSAAVAALFEFIGHAPDEARLLSLDVVGADPVVARRALASNERFADMLGAGRRYYPEAMELPEVTEIALVTAISSLLNSVFIADRTDRIDELKPQVVQMMLMPYIGVAEAQRLALAA